MKKILLFLMPALLTAACQSSVDKEPDEQKTKSPAVLTESEQQAYLNRGKEIAQATFAELSGELAAALEAGGVAGAISYCNLAAYPLVDSLSQVHQAVIRRTSFKVRNLADKPSPVEEKVLQEYQQQEGELKPKVMVVDDQEVAFFAPIKIQPLCLNCHGKVGESPGINPDDYAVIKKHYPQDEATGYELGDLRGMWSITFKR